MNDYLKLGSVVKIKNSPMELMIVGYYPEAENKTVYTYIGINHSCGFSFKDEAVFFNQDMISDVLYEGYSDDNSDDFLNNLKNYMRTPHV